MLVPPQFSNPNAEKLNQAGLGRATSLGGNGTAVAVFITTRHEQNDVDEPP
jgi:tartrate dehydratase alpha subunit/fumarate hydratase class I-like protein